MKHPKKTTSTARAKRFNTAALLAVLLFAVTGTILIVLSKAAGNATLALVPSSGSYAVNTVFSVVLEENSGSEAVSTVDIKMTYDQTKLQFISISTAGSPFNFCTESTGGGGQVSLVCTIIGGSVSGKQTLGNLSFKTLIGSGSTSVFFRSDSRILKSDGSDADIWNGNTAGGTYSLTTPANPLPPSGGGSGSGSSSGSSSGSGSTVTPATGSTGSASGTTSSGGYSGDSSSSSISSPETVDPSVATQPESGAIAQTGANHDAAQGEAAVPSSVRALMPLGVGLLVLAALLVGLPLLQRWVELRQIQGHHPKTPTLRPVLSSPGPTRVSGSSIPGIIIKPRTAMPATDMTLDTIEKHFAAKK